MRPWALDSYTEHDNLRLQVTFFCIKSQYHDYPAIRRETQSLLLFQWFITHLLSHILAALQVVVTVWKDLRLNNGYNAMLGEWDRKQCHDKRQQHFLCWFCDFLDVPTITDLAKKEPADFECNYATPVELLLENSILNSTLKSRGVLRCANKCLTIWQMLA